MCKSVTRQGMNILVGKAAVVVLGLWVNLHCAKESLGGKQHWF